MACSCPGAKEPEEEGGTSQDELLFRLPPSSWLPSPLSKGMHGASDCVYQPTRICVCVHVPVGL